MKADPTSRRQVRDFNGLITCSVCQGYIIEATTITECLHTFCRSCILKHLEKSNLCPTCFLKPVTVASLRPDRILKTLIYKLVPGLYQSEVQRVAEFHGGALAGKLSAGRRRFSGLVGIPSPEGKASHDDDINHNISSKKSESEHSDDADFFHPEEPISLSMEYHPEAAVTLGGQKASIPPIRYLQCPAAVTVWHLQRFISTKFDLKPSLMLVEIIYEDEILPRDFSLMDVAYCYNWKRVAPMRFYYRIFMQTPEKSGTTDKNRNYMTKADEKKEVKAKIGAEKKMEDVKKGKEASGGVMKTFLATTETKTRDEFEFVDETAVKNESQQYNSLTRRAAGVPIRDNVPNVRIEKMKLEDGVKTVKLTMISPKSETTNAKPKFKIESAQVNDFKRLRSNDSEFGDVKPQSVVVPETKSKTKVSAQSSAKPSAREKKSPSDGKRRNADDDSPDELSCSKSSTKKCYINRNKKSQHELENGTKQPNLPTLKVDLTSLKTKITLPKAEKSPDLKLSERPRTEIEETSPNKYEYVKNIGLLPISDVLEARKAKSEAAIVPVKEKKRKKMKHSKEPSEKRPKLHAEMIPNEKEPIKLKLKFTNSKPSKNEKKTPNGTGEIPKISIPLPIPIQPKTSKDSVAEMRKVRHKSHSSVNTALNRTLSEQSAAIQSLVRRMSVDLPQLPYIPPTSNKSVSSPPQPKPAPVQTTKPSPPQSPRVNSTQAMHVKPAAPKAYPGLLSPKAADRGSRFSFPMTSPTYNARPASFPPYPMPLSRPLPPPKTATSTFTASSTKPLVSVLKRSSSLDACPVAPKHVRIEEPPVRTQMPPLNRTNSSPPKSPEKSPFYTSTMSSTYTHENNVKKPLPMLLPPSSISVTKMSDVPNASAPVSNDKRPAVEIVRINSSTPAIDQQKMPSQKTIRPPPATIPLVKIKKSAANTPTVAAKPATSPPIVSSTTTLTVNNNKVPPLNISVANLKSQSAEKDREGAGPPMCDNIGALDLSGKSSRSPSLEKSPTAFSAEEKLPPSSKKASEETKATVPSKPCPLPMPKLNEITKVRPPSTTALMRQQNPSVRSIPNPSALAFRNQVLPVPPESKTPKSTVAPLQSTSVTNSVANTVTSEKPKVTTPDLVASTKTPIVSHKPAPKLETPEVVSIKKNTIEQVAATLRAAAGDPLTKVTKLN
ncbi:protein suppressor 2 of zeste [Phlebotomus argentipes]|uniref:protein suppressor 2 of zeste n=1 Tax=Phlebotomus argentipes TaxID=94469 RepID=UPI002892B37B|nr:protein suppressor 2 of zeste [Phlebotomus argentipes]